MAFPPSVAGAAPTTEQLYAALGSNDPSVKLWAMRTLNSMKGGAGSPQASPFQPPNSGAQLNPDFVNAVASEVGNSQKAQETPPDAGAQPMAAPQNNYAQAALAEGAAATRGLRTGGPVRHYAKGGESIWDKITQKASDLGITAPQETATPEDVQNFSLYLKERDIEKVKPKLESYISNYRAHKGGPGYEVPLSQKIKELLEESQTHAAEKRTKDKSALAPFYSAEEAVRKALKSAPSDTDYGNKNIVNNNKSPDLPVVSESDVANNVPDLRYQNLLPDLEQSFAAQAPAAAQAAGNNKPNIAPELNEMRAERARRLAAAEASETGRLGREAAHEERMKKYESDDQPLSQADRQSIIGKWAAAMASGKSQHFGQNLGAAFTASQEAVDEARKTSAALAAKRSAAEEARFQFGETNTLAREKNAEEIRSADRAGDLAEAKLMWEKDRDNPANLRDAAYVGYLKNMGNAALKNAEKDKSSPLKEKIEVLEAAGFKKPEIGVIVAGQAPRERSPSLIHKEANAQAITYAKEVVAAAAVDPGSAKELKDAGGFGGLVKMKTDEFVKRASDDDDTSPTSTADAVDKLTPGFFVTTKGKK